METVSVVEYEEKCVTSKTVPTALNFQTWCAIFIFRRRNLLAHSTNIYININYFIYVMNAENVPPKLCARVFFCKFDA